MNKTEKLIAFLLGLGLVWCFMSGIKAPENKDDGATDEGNVSTEQQKDPEQDKKDAAARAENPTNSVMSAAADGVSAPTNGVPAEVSAAASSNDVPAVVTAPAEPPKDEAPQVEIPVLPAAVLENDELRLEINPVGAVVTKATLKAYAQSLGESASENPLVMSFAGAPLGRLTGVPGVTEGTVFAVTTNEAEHALTFTAGGVVRKYTLGANYKLTLEETFADDCRPAADNGLGLGCIYRGTNEHDTVAVDSWLAASGVVHHDDDDSVLKGLLTGSSGGGCSCGSAQVDDKTPVSQTVDVPGSITWLALKNRFFTTALVKTSQANTGFGSTVTRDSGDGVKVYRARQVEATVNFNGGVESRTTEFYIGPKKQELLWGEDMKDVMEFGWWRWICYPVVWTLNLFNSIIPNYGIAIILLTILVRLLFWPLTRKSTEGMKKMQEIQPLLKELQAKYKDNPQRLQQETFALYREKKVNPLSSCLPMLIQIPVFFALYKVLGNSVELRHASFLWIADLSEPEALFASWFPFGGLNILPILMAATMYLQSRLTPTAGDPSQQRMMQIMMPLMMLWMFYNFASGLSLYWTLSQVMSIIQMWMIRRKSAQQAKVFEPEIIDPPNPTRQQRRHQ